MANAEVIRMIKKMKPEQLLDFVIENPEYLIDSYYAVFGEAIKDRHRELIKQRNLKEA